MKNQPAGDVWIEKVYAKGRKHKESGECALSKAILSPQKDKRGADIYKKIKTDASGNMQWNKTYSTDVADVGIHLIQTADGGYAMVGWNYGNGQDFVLYKTDADGNLQWNMTYGGTGVENGYALLQSSDGGYVLTGNTNSFGAGGNDIWLVKTNGLGVVPEGLTLEVMLLLSTIAVIVSVSYFRKRPKRQNW